MDKRIERVEELKKQIESEKDFLHAADLFAEAAPLIKELLAEGEKKHGRVLELVREMDEYIEKEIKIGSQPC